MTGYAVKTLESKETRAQRERQVTHNSVFAVHRLNAGQQPHIVVRHFRCTRELRESTQIKKANGGFKRIHSGERTRPRVQLSAPRRKTFGPRIDANSFLGSAPVSGAGFGVPPKQSLKFSKARARAGPWTEVDRLLRYASAARTDAKLMRFAPLLPTR